MPPLTWFERAGGRKFVVSMLGMVLGVGLVVLGLVLVVSHTGVASSIVELVGQGALVVGGVVTTFTGANAAVTWKHGGPPTATTETESRERIRDTEMMPVMERTESTKVSTPVSPTPQPPGE